MPSKKQNRKKRHNQNPPPKQELQKNLIEEIPEIIPVISSKRSVMFPSSTFTIRLSDPETKPLIPILKEKPYLIIRPRLADGREFSVGVLGTITNLDETDPEHVVFSFNGICRVHIEEVEKQNGITMAKKKIFVELPIPEAMREHPRLREELAALQNEFPIAFSIFIQELLEENARLFFEIKFVQDILVRLQHVDSENLSSVIDGVMNLLNQIPITITVNGKPLDIFNPSLSILAEPAILIRLKRTTDIAILVFQYSSALAVHRHQSHQPDESEDELDELLKDAQTGTPPKSGRETIQEELSRPHEIKPRFPPLSQEPITEPLVKLDPEQPSKLEQTFFAHMKQYIVNQNLLKKRMAQTLIRLHTGIADSTRPIILGIICGPTGVGKTESVKALAEFLLDDPAAFTRLDCGDYLEPHDHKRITGAPHSYIGYGDETEISQWKLDQYHFKKQLRERYRDEPKKLAHALEIADQFTEMLKNGPSTASGKDELNDIQETLKQLGWHPGEHLNILLIDEMEKAHANLMRLLLRVLDEGFLRKANGDIINFKNTIITYTSNINGKKIAQMISGKGEMGFGSPQKATSESELTETIYQDTLREIQRFLLTEVLGRIGKERIIVLHPLREKDLLEVLETITLPKLADALKQKQNIELHITDTAKSFIVRESYHDDINRTLGARALAAVVERKIEEKIGNLLEIAENGGLVSGDKILIDTETVVEGEKSKQKICIKKVIRSS